MAKMIVEIDFPDDSKASLEASLNELADDWFPLEDKTLISVDHAYLQRDPVEDSFYVFRLRSIEE